MGCYNTSAPYVPDLSLPTDTLHTLQQRHDQMMSTVVALVQQHLTPAEALLFQQVTAHTVKELLAYMASTRATLQLQGHAGCGVLRFLSADRFIHDVPGNLLGLHVLRATLARKVTDARRTANGAAAHSDYTSFQTNGYVTKDFSTMNNNDLKELLVMVSGYKDADLPTLVWALRESVGNIDDNNLDLHVDTFAPSWKVWLYAEDIGEEHGPLTYVRGSHLPSASKLKFLYQASIDPALTGASSYGSFRIGMYGGRNHSTTGRWEQEECANQRPADFTGHVKDAAGVWNCHGCVDNERSFGMESRVGIVGPKMTLVVADVSGLHARGLSKTGKVRRTFVLHGSANDGGLQRVNPFSYGDRIEVRGKDED